MVDKLTSEAARAMQAARKSKVGGFSDPEVRKLAMDKSLETRRKNTNVKKQQTTEGEETVSGQDKTQDR